MVLTFRRIKLQTTCAELIGHFKLELRAYYISEQDSTNDAVLTFANHAQMQICESAFICRVKSWRTLATAYSRMP